MMRNCDQTTLPDLFMEVMERFTDHGIGFRQDDGSTRFHTFSQIHEIALKLLGALQSKGIGSGDVVILSVDKASEAIPLFWCCQFGGIVPAMLQPPVAFSSYNRAAEKIENVYRLLDNPFLILSHSYCENWRSGVIPAGNIIDYEDLAGSCQGTTGSMTHPDDLALIQFSSGSTGDPKGVMLTHRNILTNISDIVMTTGLRSDDIYVSWMPLYHDMGLVGFHLTPLSTGGSHYIIDTADFVRNPGLWLDFIDRYHGTVTGCPNFGQVLINRYLSRKRDFDFNLSSVRIIFNGAEPISVSTMETFIDNLSKFGLSPVAMLPAYGLAEATLAVTFPPVGEEVRIVRFCRNTLIREELAVEAGNNNFNVVELVDLGHPLPECRIKITDESGRESAPDHIGHVMIQGKNVTQGYWNPARSDRYFFNTGWIDTGDLGFIHNGSLFITGRTKDVIFANGNKYYAHDLEHILLGLDDIPGGRIVVAGCFDDSAEKEKILVFLIGSDPDKMEPVCTRIRHHFATLLGLHIGAFVLIRSHDIPYTSSGKLQRYQLVNRYKMGDFSRKVKC